ncbi:hypothetical protein HanRHA438_Chr02g0080381 [Helianthus annuus]|nr:hypothetical protein HanRHA438_Chr02g0080381 [Helianthus annuus]
MSPIREFIPNQTEEVHVTPSQQHQEVPEPSSVTKKNATPRGFEGVDDFDTDFADLNLGSSPVPNIEDLYDIPSFGESERFEARIERIEQDKVASDAKLKAAEEKIKIVEAKNVVLKNEVLDLNEKVEELQAGNMALNEVVNELLTTNEQLNATNVSLGVENELVKKVLEDLQVDKEIKSKQLEKLYAMIEDRLGLNVDATFNQIGIRRAEAQRIEHERRDAEEAAEAAKDKGKGKAVEDVMESSSYKDKANDVVLFISQFNLVGTPVTVQYSKEETSRRIEVEHRRMKSKKDDKKDDEEDDEEEYSDDVFQDIDDYHYSGDDNNDDGQGGNGGALIVRPSGSHEVVDYVDDSQNEQHDDVHPQGESTLGAPHDESVNLFSNTPKVVYLNHDVEEGELVENLTRKTMMEALGINDENFKSDIEDEIPTTTPDSE